MYVASRKLTQYVPVTRHQVTIVGAGAQMIGATVIAPVAEEGRVTQLVLVLRVERVVVTVSRERK